MIEETDIMSNYERAGRDIGKLVASKQEAYGDSFGQSYKVLEILYPNGISVEQYPDMLTITRIIDKLFRIANEKDAFGESPYGDITGYGLLGYVKDELAKIKRIKLEDVNWRMK